ncbi:MAG: hypothetical protein ACT4N9_09450 [Paracoccaceae bacterium]
MALTLALVFALVVVLGVRLLHAQGLSADQRDRVLRDRAEFVEAAAIAINWFGDPRGLNAAAIEDYIAAERAERRAGVIRALMAADLSADGTVSAAEVARLAPTLTPTARGRLIALHAAADADADGIAGPGEMAALARAEALRLVSDDRAETLRVLLLFDTDGDGWVLLDEVRAAIAGLAV